MSELKIYNDVEQSSPEWFSLRCGILTASVIGQLITGKTIKPASNDYSRALIATLVAERITGRVESTQETRPMLRGNLDEPIARDHYSEHHAPVTQVGFMVQDFGGFKLGFSPDGLVGDDGLIEIKSRAQKKHLQTILSNEVPIENMAQIQTGLLVSGRMWCDYVSWSGGFPMWVIRVRPSPDWFTAIDIAAECFEMKADAMVATYADLTEGLPPTEYVDHFAELEITF